MIATSLSDLKVDYWYTICCQRDLEQVESQEHAQHIINFFQDHTTIEVWPTKLEALRTIRRRWQRAGEPEEVANCDSLIHAWRNK